MLLGQSSIYYKSKLHSKNEAKFVKSFLWGKTHRLESLDKAEAGRRPAES